MMFFYIEHVTTCIYLRGLEKRGLKRGEEHYLKRRARATLPHQSLRG